MRCTNPIFIQPEKQEILYRRFPLGIKVGCGKCYSCRAKKSMEKTIRFIHEYETLKKKENWKIFFITVTFDKNKIKEAHTTENGELTLNKEWIRKKRDSIYSKLYRKFKKTGTEFHKMYKYMIAGEYGENGTQRPHYHMILMIKDSYKYILSQFRKRFKNGRYDEQEAISTNSIYYTAGYTQKKIGANEKNDNIEEPFLIMSRGLGKNWVLEDKNYWNAYIKNYLDLPTKKGIIKIPIPRIYHEWAHRYEIVKDEQLEEWHRIKKERVKEMIQKQIEDIKEKVQESHLMVTKENFVLEAIQKKDDDERYHLIHFNIMKDVKEKVFKHMNGENHSVYFSTYKKGILKNAALETKEYYINEAIKRKVQKKLEEKNLNRQLRRKSYVKTISYAKIS